MNAQRSDKKTLLVVEDDPGLQSQLKWCFVDYEVLMAGDRDTALGHLRRHEPRVVTLDLGLPPDPANASEGLALMATTTATTPSKRSPWVPTTSIRSPWMPTS